LLLLSGDGVRHEMFRTGIDDSYIEADCLRRRSFSFIGERNELKLKNKRKVDSLLKKQEEYSKVIKEWIKGEPSKLMILFRDYLEFRNP
jgi:hypothetical protein